MNDFLTRRDAYQQGMEDRLFGMPLSANPLRGIAYHGNSWECGWKTQAAKEELASVTDPNTGKYLWELAPEEFESAMASANNAFVVCLSKTSQETYIKAAKECCLM